MRVQQLMRDGNLRHLSLSLPPIGDMHRIMWKLSLSYSMNSEYMLSYVSGIFFSANTLPRASLILSKSSF